MAYGWVIKGVAETPVRVTPMSTHTLQPPATTPLPPSATMTSSATLVPSTATVIPASATATIAATATTTPTASRPAISHFASGQEFTVTFIRMNAASAGWAIGGLESVGDHVFTTADGGNTWMDVTPPEPVLADGVGLSAMGFFPSAHTAWVVYYRLDYFVPAASVIWRTQDSGKSWQASHPLDLSTISGNYLPADLSFTDEHNGWMLAHVGAGMNHDYVMLYHTSDGGQTWVNLIDPTNNDGGIQSCHKTGLLFLDAQHGWLTGDCGGVASGVLLYRTADSGSTWVSVDLPAPASDPTVFDDAVHAACGSYDPQFSDLNNGKFEVKCFYYDQNPAKTETFLYSTQDGGNTWASAPYPGGTLIMLDSTNGWALDRIIYQTTDGGANWTKQSAVTWDAQFSFISAQVGWAVARAGDQIALVTTANGGKKWAEIHPIVAP